MRLHRFYIAIPIAEESVTVSDERLIHQWRNVFRYNVGTEVIVFDGSGFEYEAIIQKLNNREALLNIVSKRQGVVPKRHVVLYQSLIKKDKMEWVVEKVTELGVSRIILIVSDRSEKKGFNIERARKIAIEASEQCGRADVPEIVGVVDLARALEDCENVIVFDSSGITLNHESRIMNYDKNSLFIGPEGGWSDRELELLKQKGAQVYSLGPLTLRAETAAVVAVSKFI